MKKKCCLKNLVLFFIIGLLCGGKVGTVYANEDVEVVSCVLSEAYKEWLLLSDEDKDKTLMPAMCDSEANKTDIAASGVKSKVESMFTQGVRATLPARYDIRDTSFTTVIKNQGSTGGCWTFATTTALEVYMKKKYGLDFIFSARHIEYVSTRKFLDGVNRFGYNRTLDTGGNYYMTSSYLSNGLGPIAEEELPFSENMATTYLSEIENKNVLLDVNDILVEYNTLGTKCSSSQINKVKELVYEYGAVMANVNMIVGSTSIYYNSLTGASYYNGSPAVNHAVTIVGWDDNYSRNNFKETNRPTSNGAWIVQNSYSSGFGDGGYNYVSYEDLGICYGFMVITEADQEIEDNSYIYDRLGFNSAYGFQTTSGVSYTTGYAMNVFDKETGKTEILKEITIGTAGVGSYKIYFIEGNGENIDIEDMRLIGSGDIEYSGYITHKLENPIILADSVTEFSIVVHYSADNLKTPIPLSVQDGNKYAYVSVMSDSSYISYDGDNWLDLATYFNIYCVASIKAFTDDVDYNIEVVDYSFDGDKILDIGLVSDNVSSSNLKVLVYNVDSKEVSVDDVSYTESNGKISNINIKFNSSMENGKYRIVLYYSNSFVGEINLVIANGVYSDTYAINKDSLLIYVPPETLYSTFIKNIYGINGNLYRPNNTIVNSGVLATGMKIDGFTIIVKGDVTGDGYVKMADVMKISNYIVENTGMTEEYYLMAADVIVDNSIKMTDVMKISNYIVEGGAL